MSSANPNQPATFFPTYQLKPTRQPMLWAALAYSLGIIAGVYLLAPYSSLIGSTLAFLSASSYFIHKRTRIALSLALASLFLLGVLHIQLKGTSSPPDPILSPLAYGPDVELTAHVTREGKVRESSPGEQRQTLDIETEAVQSEGGSPTPRRSGVRLNLYADEHTAMRVFRYGERLRVPVKLKLPRNFHNPGAFDYEGYLAENGISALGSAKADAVQFLPGFSGNRI
jgi:hypothetical protein